jgi:hypothetical protein
MKKIITTDISGTVGMPVKSGTLDHLQAAYKESMNGLARSILAASGLPSPTSEVLYILDGVTGTGTTTFSYTGGWVFYKPPTSDIGEIFQVDAGSIVLSSGQIPRFEIVESNFLATNADPVEFTDGSSKSVHLIRKMRIIAAADTGSPFNYADIDTNRRVTQRLSEPTEGEVILTAANMKFDNSPFSQIYLNESLGEPYVSKIKWTRTGNIVQCSVKMYIRRMVAATSSAGNLPFYGSIDLPSGLPPMATWALRIAFLSSTVRTFYASPEQPVLLRDLLVSAGIPNPQPVNMEVIAYRENLQSGSWVITRGQHLFFEGFTSVNNLTDNPSNTTLGTFDFWYYAQ